jgi:tetratricopeptide (TPR) repeat protein
VAGGGSLGKAERAKDLVRADPGRAEALAAEALAEAGDDLRAVAVARRVLGMTAREDQRFEDAEAHLLAAVDAAEGAGARALAASCRMSLAGALLFQGRYGEALALVDAAIPALSGVERARARFQRAAVLQVSGDEEAAARAYETAERALRRVGDRLTLAQLYNNRGQLRLAQGRVRRAGDDLRRAESIYDELGLGKARADVRANLGVAAAREGDLLAALRWYEQADAELAGLGREDPLSLKDRVPALLVAGLSDEATDTARRAVELLEPRGRSTYLADAMLVQAEAELAAGDAAAAGELGRAAADQFADFGHARATVDARAVATLADLADAGAAAAAGPRAVAAARALAGEAEQAGLPRRALDLHLAAGEAAAARGDVAVADRELAMAAGGRASGPVDRRLRGWRAEAGRRLAAGDRRGALRAASAGLAVLDRYRDALGAVELRAAVAAHGTELAALGLRVAVEDHRPAAVLSWAERHRAVCLQRPPVRPPHDPVLGALLGELRTVTAALDGAARAGRRATELDARRRRLEEAVRRRALLAPSAGATAAAGVPVADLAARLGDGALVEYLRLGDRLAALTVVDGELGVCELGDAGPVVRECRLLRFALGRLAGRDAAEAAGRTFAANAAHAAAALDARLVAPLAGAVGDRPIVVVPTGDLHALPWAALPSLRGRPVTVAPSATVWAAAVDRPEPQGHRLLVAGPDLPHAGEEVSTLRRAWPGARTLTGRRATVAAVLTGLDGASVAHVAAHGHVRADQPLLSSLRLVDGRLTVYDLDRLERPPGLLVLSACDTGLSAVRPGDELMGFVAALLALGTRTVVAATGPLPDDAAAPFMAAVHRRRDAGRSAAEAVAEAQAECDEPAAAFVVPFGAG